MRVKLQHVLAWPAAGRACKHECKSLPSSRLSEGCPCYRSKFIHCEPSGETEADTRRPDLPVYNDHTFVECSLPRTASITLPVLRHLALY